MWNLPARSYSSIAVHVDRGLMASSRNNGVPPLVDGKAIKDSKDLKLKGALGVGSSHEEWALEIHKPKENTKVAVGDEEVVEQENENFVFDMDEIEASLPRRFLAMALYKSDRTFNPRFLFEDMAVAWRIADLAPVQRLEDKKFLVEFKTEEELLRVVNGGPWIYRGDALLMVHYDLHHAPV